MAFNKSKALESALKYLNQGKVAQAISEYQQILRNDARDQATLMTVGDLFARQGDMTQAVEYFERLAHVYLSDGFNSKAIAIYKKIAKLAPAELAPLERLADLYVQQGVLSEARPLFLQIAEAHLKANQASKAVDVLHRLLEIEPENPRVQMRLAELYSAMGQKKEAAQTYINYAQRLYGHGEVEDAQKLMDRALEVDPGNPVAVLMKGRALAAGSKNDQAIKVLETHPEAEAGGEITDLIVDLELRSGHLQKAADRARRQLARGHEHFALLHKVTDSMIEGGKAEEALPVLNELRAPMIEAGAQDGFVKSLSSAVEHLAGEIEPLEMLVDFCRHTSDSFRLPDAISRLSDTYAAQGNFPRAEELLQELIDRNKNDDRLVARMNELRARSSGSTTSIAEVKVPVVEAETTGEKETEAPSATPAPIVEEALDEETERYITQALTDVDLFSSYGLAQKAAHLLENVLQRAPRHTPTLERLLDMYLGAGNERRTTELAAQLEQIHRERNDTINADRFAELRQRFQKLAGLTTEELQPSLPPAPAPASATPEPVAQTEEGPRPAVAAPPHVTPPPPAPSPTHAEFEIPLAPIVTEPVPPEAPIAAGTEEETAAPPAPPVPPAPAEPQPVAASEEVDLSDEWEAMSQEVLETVEPPAPAVTPPPEPQPAETPEASEEPSIEIIEEPMAESLPAEPVPAQKEDFELELMPKPPVSESKAAPASSEDFINKLVAEIEDMVGPAAEPAAAKGEETTSPAAEVAATSSSEPAGANSIASPSPPESAAENLNELAEVFQEFRSELGEMGEENEDLETHYNLGIAYREMGLLDEAIGEFQKVAKAVHTGKPFRYAMNCSTLLALSFMEKSEPKIASLWYLRALETPGLDQESILALRYDLGVAQELSGDAEAALESFREVYAINIDYRDVADRIATLQKH
jgi:tetratricopeptide (TPR) repeat protein